MNASILTSDRYIAIKSATGLTYNKTLRILNKGGEIIPARWNDANKRLESVAINQPDAPIFMYEKSRKIEEKLAAAGINFEWLNESQAKELTS
jgi:hypothetical protein